MSAPTNINHIVWDEENCNSSNVLSAGHIREEDGIYICVRYRKDSETVYVSPRKISDSLFQDYLRSLDVGGSIGKFLNQNFGRSMQKFGPWKLKADNSSDVYSGD